MTATVTEKPRTATARTAEDDGHVWVGAATVVLTLAQAKRADLRGSIRVPEETRIDVLDTYCKACRRPFEDVAGRKCAAITDPELFHGGPIGTRAKRTGHGIPGHDCIALGCNTAIAVAAAQVQAGRRNGAVPDVRKTQPAPAAPEVRRRRRTRNVAAAVQAPAPLGIPRLPGVTGPLTDDDARLAARILASRRGRKRERNPLALMLW
jgi:hypothetical protein